MKYLTIGIAVLFYIKGFAQSPVMYVYTVTGKVSVVQNDHPRFLKQWDSLYEKDVIVVGKATHLRLITRRLKIIDLNQAGSYSYGALQQRLSGSETNITQTYANLILHQLMQSRFNMLVSPEAIGDAIGGPERGDCITAKQPLNQGKIATDTIRFTWKALPDTRRYQFRLRDQAKAERLNIVLTDTVLLLLRKELLQTSSARFYWNITPDNGDAGKCSNAFHVFTVVSPDRQRQETDSIVRSVTRGPELYLDLLQISDRLALSGWMSEAFDYYEAAMKELPPQTK